MENKLNFNDTQAKAQIENFWKYLDDLSEKDPEEYKKFISQQMKKGLNQEQKDKKEEEKKSLILKPKSFICLRFKILKIKKESQGAKDKDIKLFDSNPSADMQAIPKVLFSFEWQSEAFSNKVLEEPKVYLNLIHAEEFTPPLDENNKILKNPENDQEWRYVPTEFRYNNKKTCMSGKRCDFYDMMVNSKVIESISKNEELKKSILAYFVRKFVIFLNEKYELFTNNVKILKSKKYKSVKSQPEEFIFKHNEKYGSTGADSAKEDKKPEFTPAKNFFEIPENKINIPQCSENFTNTPSFYNLPTQAKEKKPKAKTPAAESVSKKILIEEVTKIVKRTIGIKKTILSLNEMEVKFILESFDEVESISDIDLQVSENAIKLNLEKVALEEYEPIDMNFDFNVDPDKCLARFDKKNKILKLVLFKINQ